MCFEDTTSIEIYDDRQLCCEYRHMYCYDDLQNYIGAIFTGIELREGDKEYDTGDDFRNDVREC